MRAEDFLDGATPAPRQSAEDFLGDTGLKSRSIGEVVNDAGAQLAKGVNTIAGAVPNLVAPESGVSKFFRDNAQFWDDAQSEHTKAAMRAAEERITAAEKNGVWDEFSTAAKEYMSSPALFQKFVVENLPSMIPGLGAAKGAQVAARGAQLAKGATAAEAAAAGVRAGTAAGAASNSVLNAGGARQDAFDDWKQTAMAQGMSEEDATQLAIEKSRLAAAVGGVAGAVSGGTGLERNILGNVGRGGARGFAAGAAKELAGEQLEELSPQAATNAQIQSLDPNRPLTHDLGRTAAQTLVASAPGSIVSGATESVGHRSTDAAEADAPAAAGGEAPIQPDGGGSLAPLAPVATDAGEAGAPAGEVATAPQLEAPQALEGEVIGPETLPSGQRLLESPPIEGELVREPPALMRPMLPPPEQGGPTERQLTTARGLLNLSRTASPETLMRLMRVDQSMAGMLFSQWQSERAPTTTGEQNGRIASDQADAQVAAPRAGGGSRVVQGSGDVLASTLAIDSNGTGNRTEVAASGMRSPVAVGGEREAGVATLDAKAHEAATSPLNSKPQPSDAQKEAGNYAKGHVTVQGLPIAIENPAGSVRSGKDANGKPWQTEMQHHYGYIKGTVGRDKDHLDVFLGPRAEQAGTAYVVDQVDPKTGRFDEHKIVIGAESEQEARAIYQSNYQSGWKGLGAITPMPMGAFKAWIASGDTKKPVGLKVGGNTSTATAADEVHGRVSAGGSGESDQANAKPSGRQTELLTPDGRASSDATQTDQTPADAGVSAFGEDAGGDSETVVTPAAVAAQADSIEPATIADFGEKIGGARKDKAVPLGPRGRIEREVDERPAWARKFHAMQILPMAGRSNQANVGKWQLMYEAGAKGQVKRVSSDVFNTEQEALDAIPLAAVARKHRVAGKVIKDAAGERTEWGIYRDITDRKRVLVKGGFDTREAAMIYMAEHAAEIVEHKFDFPEKPWLDRIERIGPTRHTGNVTTRMFADTFGFRGGEFGNWNMGSDGQAALNHAYDALLDLADAIGVPPKAISLNGELGIAFGARGTGGKNAASAHYEPGYVVINLTKIKGAGSAAHEWWHAADHYFARNGGWSDSHSVVADGYRIGTAARKELVAAIKHVVDTMTRAERSSVSDAQLVRERAQKRLGESLRQLDYYLADLRRQMTSADYRPKNKQALATEAQLQLWDSMVARLRDGDMGEDTYIPNPSKTRGAMGFSTGAVLKEMNDLYKSIVGRNFLRHDPHSTGRVMHWTVKAIGDNKAALNTQEDVVTTSKGSTNYVIEARRIDQYRTGDYWSMPEELGARAFESYIFDKLTGQGNRSDYLVYAVENRYYARMDMKPYPEGDERKAINAAFDRLFETVKTRETEKGVALESRRISASPTENLPDAIIAKPLAETKSDDFKLAKAGSVAASLRLAKQLITPALVDQLRGVAADKPLVVGVSSIEATGKNALPRVAAALLADRLGIDWSSEIVQSTTPKRTDMDGLGRIFNRPEFYGDIEPGRGYILLDDTLTQGGTFAGLAAHIEAGGGHVVAVVALTGKQYSSKLSPTAETLQQVQEKFGDIEGEFKRATGYGFDGLTESEARYLARFDSPAAIRDRIIAEAGQGADGGSNGNPPTGARSSLTDKTPPPGGVSASGVVTALRNVVDRFKSQFKGAAALDIRVVDHADQIPVRFRPSPYAEGVFHDDAGLIYLVGSNLSRGAKADTLRAFQVLMHEAVGHYGLSTMMGQRFNGLLKHVMRVARNAKVTDDIYGPGDAEYATVEAVRLRYPDASDEEVAQEVMARMAESGVTDARFGYIRAVVRQWLRDMARALGFDMAVTTAELNDLIAKASGYMRAGRNLQSEAEPSGLVAASKRVAESATESPAFKRWFGNSKVVDENGKPLVVYHGTKSDFQEFDPKRIGASDDGLAGKGFYFTYNPDEASAYALNETFGRGDSPNVQPVYVSLQNPLVITHGVLPDGRRLNELHGGVSITAKGGAAVRKLAMDGGHDGVMWVSRDGAVRHVVAWSPEQIKSAIGNRGTFDPASPDIRESRSGLESRAHVAGDSGRQYGPALQQTFRNIGREVVTPTIKERVAGLWQNIGKKLQQGIADQFAPLKELGGDAYLLSRMSKGADGALEAMLMYGRVFLNGGVYDVDVKDGGMIDKLLRPLGKEVDDFMWWIAGNRAEQLAAQGREHLMTPADIANLKALGTGQLDFDYTLQNGQTTRDRARVYAEAKAILNAFNKSVLDIAEQSGLIDGAERAIWESDFYVPFYREAEEGDKPKFPNVKKGLVRQKAFERLKGGTDKLNHDLLANTLMNMSHLLNAAAKNRAAKASLQAAERAGVATRAVAGEKGAVFFRDGGKEIHYTVEDPFVLDAVTALEFSGFSGPAMQAMGAFKRWLTIGVTASPTFKIRNLIRDSVSAIGQGELSYNLAKNIAEGYKATDRKSQTYASMLASGGVIRFGTMIENNRADHVRQLVEQGVDPDTILDGESKLKVLWHRRLKPLLDAYNEIGDRSENINRAALYEQLLKKGMSHAEASLAARDLLDFSMGGTFAAVRFLTQTVPFANARIQGLYKLGRAAKENPKRMGYVVGAVALASLALLAAYQDDDDWKKREDWDRDNYWWFKVGGVAYRIPKPFEIGAIGTLAERSAELLFDKEMNGHRFGERLSAMVGSTFAMNPVPQMFKPLLDLYSNKDSFTGRPIESMGMERLRTEDRYTARTSEAAKLIGQAGVLSPLQVDHIIRGYFGWLGAASVKMTDEILRVGSDNPRPSMQLRDTFLVGNFVETLPTNSSRYVSQMYEQAKEIEEAYASWRNFQKMGNAEKAAEVFEAEKDKITRYRTVQSVKAAETRINSQIRLIEANENMSGEEKRAALDRLSQQKDRIARSVVGSAGLN